MSTQANDRTTSTIGVLWRAGMLLVSCLLVAGAVVAIGFGRCHDSGGFCADEFSSTHVEAYASGAVLASLAAVAAIVPFNRRPAVVAAMASVAALLVAVISVWAESGG